MRGQTQFPFAAGRYNVITFQKLSIDVHNGLRLIVYKNIIKFINKDILALKLYQRRALDTLSRFFDTTRLSGPADAFAVCVDAGLPAAFAVAFVILEQRSCP